MDSIAAIMREQEEERKKRATSIGTQESNDFVAVPVVRIQERKGAASDKGDNKQENNESGEQHRKGNSSNNRRPPRAEGASGGRTYGPGRGTGRRTRAPAPAQPPSPFGPPKRVHHIQGPRFPTGKLMGGSDVRFVVNKVLAPLETEDPFTDDFYYLQLQIKKSNAAAYAAETKGETPPAPPDIPRPAWKETKDKIRMQMEEIRQVTRARVRDWMKDEVVLGHMPRTNVNTPREMLAVPRLSDVIGGDGDSNLNNVPFTTRLWSMRQAVQKACHAMYTVQELQFLLKDPRIAFDPRVRNDIESEVVEAVGLLSAAIGIDSGTSSSLDSSSSVPNSGAVKLDTGLVAAILQSSKGKKLMSRSIKLLLPEHRWALVPAILSKVLQTNSSTLSRDDTRVETRLCKTLLQFVQQSQEHQQFMVKERLPDAQHFSTWLLGALQGCLETAILSTNATTKANDGEAVPSLRETLLSSRPRAEVMHIIVQVGDKAAESASAEKRKNWDNTKNTFMQKLQ
jgi:hypothetical protein